MPVRDYSETGVVRTALGAAGITPPISFVVLVKLHGPTDPEWFISFEDSGHENAHLWDSFGVETPSLCFYPGGATSTNPPREVWCLMAGTKTTGSSKANFYIYRYDTKEWTHIESTGAFTWTFGETPAEIQLGKWNAQEPFQGRYAAAAIFPSVLTQAELEALAAGPIKSAWLAKSPKALWMFNQKTLTEELVDLTGNGANQISRVGTVVVEEEPPIPYEGEAGGKTVKVLKGGVIVNGKRWVLKNGILVNA